MIVLLITLPYNNVKIITCVCKRAPQTKNKNGPIKFFPITERVMGTGCQIRMSGSTCKETNTAIWTGPDERNQWRGIPRSFCTWKSSFTGARTGNTSWPDLSSAVYSTWELPRNIWAFSLWRTFCCAFVWSRKQDMAIKSLLSLSWTGFRTYRDRE